ncbi:UDP-N-acetyl-alpha-D-glucosamine C6 dehydratase [Austwickia sp. TVS 96-490-7B]|uniref:polysaccharide biosynthesis protein n=1 Tax=Austwickia sp. TVS 96-490-7B TaxID=2830843 RepID=UPI001C55F7F7|nr:nucleoside-diphosphate sugar epimerase/dehydratase [Austwickia sp. TVS 96-490-7B]MBW3084632.1 UDP-N-acetyl-alpha-D-glucosamine C6 dehydratase [Austwickia sp. TVS 96-490-7B]
MQTQSSTTRARLRRWLWAAADVVIWVLAVFAAVLLRFDFSLPELLSPVTVLTLGLMCGLLQLVFGSLLGPYRVSHTRGSYEETFDLMRSMLTTTVSALLIQFLLWHPTHLPRSGSVMGSGLALLGSFALRLMFRSFRTREIRTRADSAERAIVYGAGDTGRRLIKSAIREQEAGILPVALLDDTRERQRLRIEGIAVRGTKSDLREVAEQVRATMLIVAAPHATAADLRELSEGANEAGLKVKILPSLSDVLDPSASGAGVRDLRDLDLTDLLSRPPVQLDTTAIAAQIQGRRVLVTGAGGSIGSELCRQIAKFSPERLFLLDRDESGLQATQMSLTGQGLLDSDDVLLADIRDPEGLRLVFETARPQVVFHAAALKHLPLLESFPLEAWKTNVLGTYHVLCAASEMGVEAFVNVSTDKAADPTSTLGYSKRCTERLTSHFARTQPGRYVSVRFGNVLGSRGSMLHAFTAQIEAGGPVTVTHPEVQRYFMLIPEACQLVLEAGTIGHDGEVMVLEMGEQVKIIEVARNLIRISGKKDVEIVFTGLRPGEKLGEDLFADTEGRRSTAHPLVDAVDVPHLDPMVVTGASLHDAVSAYEWMRGAALGREAHRVIPATGTHPVAASGTPLESVSSSSSATP